MTFERARGLRASQEHTFILQEVAHAGATRQNQLGHILDDFGLFLGRESGEPFGKALRRNKIDGQSVSSAEAGWATRRARLTTLPCRDSRIR